jgi:hypothetical protein
VGARLFPYAFGRDGGTSRYERFEYFRAQAFGRTGELAPRRACRGRREDVVCVFQSCFLPKRNERETEHCEECDDRFHQAATSQTEHLRSVGVTAASG